MSDLTNQRPKDTYGRLLQIPNGNTGVDATLRTVTDGTGDATALSLSTGAAKITGDLEVTGGLTAPLPDYVLKTTEVTAGTGLTGGGALTTNVALAVSYGTTAGTATEGNDSRVVNAVQTTRTLTAGAGLAGGGDLSVDRTLSVNFGTTAGTAAEGNDSRIVNAVTSSRSVLAGTGLTGGGDLSADRTLSLDAASQTSLGLAGTAVQPARTLTAGTGLTGGGDLSADRSFAVTYGTTAGTAAEGHDTRITGALQTSGGTLTGAVNGGTQEVYNFLAYDVAGKLEAVGSTASNKTFDVSAFAAGSIEPTGDITIGFSNWPAGSTGFVIYGTGLGDHTITWTGVTWDGGTAPTLATGTDVDVLVFITKDGGTTVRGKLAWKV